MSTYLGAGRAVGTCLGIATMTGTEMGLITVIYNAQKGFTGGFAAFHIALAAGIVTFFVGLSGFFVCRLRDMKVLTIPEFYEKRFDRKTRILGGIMLALGGILNMGLFLKVGSMFIVGITGMSAESQALPWVMTLLLLLVLVYTVLGGMISVIITDYVQFVVLSFGILVTTYICIQKLGWTHIMDTSKPPEAPPVSTHWTRAVGLVGPMWPGWPCWAWSAAPWPTAVARALAMESTQAVKRQYMWSSASFMIRFLIPCFWGICAFVYFSTNKLPSWGHFSSRLRVASRPPTICMPCLSF